MSLTLHEARARATAIAVRSYDVRLDLTRPDAFTSETRAWFTVAGGAEEGLFIDLAGASTLAATLNGAELPTDTTYDGHRLLLPRLGPENELVLRAELPYVTTGDGMHAFTDPADGQRYVSAYCGMDLASHVFACFDQPDLKAPITLEVEAPEEWTVLANGVGARERGHWRFTTTPPISTYLFVVCAGPWTSVTFEHAGLGFGWHTRASKRAELERDVEELRAITTRCFDYYTSIFDEPYPFDSYDQVLVPELNWGAMETPGCITFRDELLAPDEPTAEERLLRAEVIAHEMAHMWFGDLTTMRWWEDSWLNESFADYMGYEVAGRAAGFTGAWVGCALIRKPTAYVADARRSTHPIAEDTEAMTDVDTAFGNFDMITYAKGNAVLRQLVTWLGEDDFLAGVNAHLTRHAFGNATLADFLDSLAGDRPPNPTGRPLSPTDRPPNPTGRPLSPTDRPPNPTDRPLSLSKGRDVRGWAAQWLRTTGFDTIRVERDGDVPVLHRAGSRAHRFHVAAYDESGTLVDQRLVDLADDPLRLEGWSELAVVPNSQDETYARVLLDDNSWSTVARTLSRVADPLTRAVLWANALDRVRHGELRVTALLDLVGAHLVVETDPVIVEGVLAPVTGRLLAQWTAPEALDDVERRVAATARALVAGAPDLQLPALRALARTSLEPAELRGWLDDGRTDIGRPVERDLRWLAHWRLAELGEADEHDIEAEVTRDPSAVAVLGAVRARAAQPTSEAKRRAWAAMHSSSCSNRDYVALSEGFWSRRQVALTAPWLDRYLDESPALAGRRGQAFSQVIGAQLPTLARPVEQVQGFRERLAATVDGEVPTVLRRSWNDRLDDVDVALRVRTAGLG
ncbi:M1 family aminopeptidase [Nocardioides terrisoli]|uniref:M1 family aminopeptidase n=1 Tax=Nocardioides terrisoli TaxID=3388267 RepID=UPI00287BBE79|nr:M1 family aminopeptidase [Nocardioides marmorisolisilvae]